MAFALPVPGRHPGRDVLFCILFMLDFGFWSCNRACIGQLQGVGRDGRWRIGGKVGQTALDGAWNTP